MRWMSRMTIVAVLVMTTACKTTEPDTDDGGVSIMSENQVEEAKREREEEAEAREEEGEEVDDVHMRQFSEEEVSFDSDGLALKGTLTLPHAATTDAPVAAVVLVHGSGPQTRDTPIRGQLGMGFPSKIDVFKDLAQALGRADFAVIRYDKRSCGPFNGCAQNGYPEPDETITEHQFVEDAIAARDFLASKETINADHIYYIGHSQGGSLATEALTKAEWGGAILLAPNYSPLDEMFVMQRDRLKTILTQTNATQEVMDAQIGPIDTLIKDLGTLRKRGKKSDAMIGGASPDFWLADFDLAKSRASRLGEIEEPMLLVFGGYDWQVPESEAKEWEKAIASSGRAETQRIIVLPGITHALNTVNETDWTKITPESIGTEISPSVITTVVSELNSMTGRE